MGEYHCQYIVGNADVGFLDKIGLRTLYDKHVERGEREKQDHGAAEGEEQEREEEEGEEQKEEKEQQQERGISKEDWWLRWGVRDGGG